MIKFTTNEKNLATVLAGKPLKLTKLVKIALRRTWREIGKDLKDEATKAILSSKSGKHYTTGSRSGGRRRRHVASAPGESHSDVSGALRRSLDWKVNGWDSLDFGYLYRPPDYAHSVEFGDPPDLKPRPTLLNAIKAQQGNIERQFASNMRDELG